MPNIMKGEINMPISNNGVYTSPSLENASDELKNMHNSELFKRLERANGIYEASYLSERWYSAFSRTGTACPQTMVNGGREYLFFTKPDLHFFEPGTTDLNEELQPYNLFREAVTTFPNEMAQLQFSSSRKYSTNNGTSNLTANQYGIDTQLNTRSPFMNLLSNSVAGSLELPTISAATTYETAQNIDGMKMLYRKSSFASDHDYEFTLEFSDTRDLNVYMLFKLYDEYERLKSDGSVTPPNIGYTLQKQLHDQFSIYKFIVDNDGTTILHYSKLTGVFPTSVPREAFSDKIGRAHV